MQFYMPTKIIEEKEAVRNYGSLFAAFGKKALIVTGKGSARLNGALDDVLTVLEANDMTHVLFEEVMENPPIEQVVEGAKVGMDCDLIIGIGGGSPLDAAKGMAILIQNPTDQPFDMLYKTRGSQALPMIAIPTTSGTGSETTPYAVFTDHNLQTKTSMTQRVFPEYAFLDVKYFMHMPKVIRNSTCVDALTHCIEAYMNTNATKYSDFMALEGMRMWGDYKDALLEDDNEEEAMATFMTASTLAGMAISQTGTSIAHSMGYPLTYHHGVSHGKANAVFMASYLNSCSNTWKVSTIMDTLGFKSLNAFDQYLRHVVGTVTISGEQIDQYSDLLMSNARKLKNHPDPVTKEDIVRMYQASVGESND